MPTITRTHDRTRPRHGEGPDLFPRGWCSTCYSAGQFVVAADAVAGTICALHLARSDAPTPDPAGPPSGGGPLARRREGPHRRPPGRAGGRRRREKWPQARGVALAAGRERAAARVDAGRFAPHPGWRNWAPPGRLVEQAVVLRLLGRLLAGQRWRADRRTAWEAVLRRLVYAATWPPDPTRPRDDAQHRPAGLVTGCSVAQLATAAGRSARTVSRVIAWAVEQGLLVVVEEGASAAFLGSKAGRTPTYAFYRPPGLHDPHEGPQDQDPDLVVEDQAPGDAPDPDSAGPATVGAAPTSANPLNGDLPSSTGSQQPLKRGLEPAQRPQPARWPVYGVPTTPAERDRALTCLFQRIGLDGGGVSRAPRWRARAMFASWWTAGWCPAALLWAIDHHPDRPDHPRGDGLRGAHNPLAVLGHRLAPWAGRRHQLPATLAGIPGDYTQPATTPASAVATAGPVTSAQWPGGPAPAAMAHTAAHQMAQNGPTATPAAQPAPAGHAVAQPGPARGPEPSPERLAAIDAFRDQQRARGVRPAPLRRRRRPISGPR